MSKENDDSLAAIKCPACSGGLVRGTKLEPDDEDDEDVSVPVATCLQCGREYDRFTNVYYSIFSELFNFDKDVSLLKLGLKGNLHGKEYEIIGRIRYQEEDEYDKATWDEWIAVCQDGTFYYFSEENGSIIVYTEHNPESIDMESGKTSIIFEGKIIKKEEAYVSRIVYTEGELPWKAEIGESSTCYDFKKDGSFFAIEQSDNEVTATRGERISYGELIEAFDISEYRQLYKNTIVKKKQYAAKSRVYLFGLLLCLGAIIYGCAFTEPVQGIMNSRQILTENVPLVDDEGSAFQSTVFFGPFDIEKGDSLYSAVLSVDQTVQHFSLEWQTFRLMLIPQSGLDEITGGRSKNISILKELFEEIDVLPEPLEVYTITGDFWDEEGRDSDGYWHESEITYSGDFVLENPGKYYLYLELYSNKKRNPSSVIVELQRSAGYRYFVVAAVIMIILWGINSIMSRTYNELPFNFSGD